MKQLKFMSVLLSACLSMMAAVAAPQAGSPVAAPPAFQIRAVAPEGSETPQAAGFEKMTTTITNSANGHIYQETLYVDKKVLIEQRDMKVTWVITNAPQNQIEIGFELTPQGRQRFAEATRQNIGKRLAMIMDGQLCSAPVVQTEISGGKGLITGNFTPQRAKELSDKINAALKE